MSRRSQGVGLDTSIVLRLLIGEPAAQAITAVAMMNELRASGNKSRAQDVLTLDNLISGIL